ncbi:MAG: radical SAM protein [Candidatus Marinimicrobia bacterium]|nr:radical SAM protein [Candidatus Neomarinimicrobiota bacterium]
MKKNQTPNYIETNCQTALNPLKRKFPYGWDLNIYRGCEHQCQYCYALYSHDYINDDNFSENIYIKSNIVEKLEIELNRKSWKREIINIGGVTDSYQPCEATYKIMPEVLKLLIKYKTPAIISTKSDLVLRDYELIDELSKITYINIAATITTTDEQIRQLIEPGAAESLNRFEMLKTFRQTNASVGLHVMPIIPYLTDSYENLDSLFYYARNAKVHYMLPGTMYLRGKTRTSFLGFIQNQFPELYQGFLDLYKKGGATREYKDNLYKMVNELRHQYQLSKSYSKPMKEKMHKI